MTNKEIELVKVIQGMQREMDKLKTYAFADAEAIIMYLHRPEPNIEGAIAKAKGIIEAAGRE